MPKGICYAVQLDEICHVHHICKSKLLLDCLLPTNQLLLSGYQIGELLSLYFLPGDHFFVLICFFKKIDHLFD